MPGAPQTMHVPAGVAIDECLRVELADVGQSNRANRNVRGTDRGSLEKRLGFGALSALRSDGTSRTSGNRLIAHKNFVCSIDGTYLDRYAETPAVSVLGGVMPAASVSTRTVAVATSTLFDVCTTNGYVASIARSTDTVGALYSFFATIETIAGVAIQSNAYIFSDASADRCALGAYGNYFILFVWVESDANIFAYYLNTTSMATIAAGWTLIGAVATDKEAITPSSSSQCAVQGTSTGVAFAYINNSAGTSRATVSLVTIAGVVDTTTVNTSSVTPDNIALQGSFSDTLWVAWNEGASVKVQGLNGSLNVISTTGLVATALSAPTDGIFVVSGSTAASGQLAVHDGTSNYFQMQSFATSAGATVQVGTQNTLFDVRLSAHPVSIGGRQYGLFRSGREIDPLSLGTSILCDWTDCFELGSAVLRPVAVAFNDLTIGHADGSFPHAIALSATTFAYPHQVERSSIGVSTELVIYDLADRGRWQSCSHNGSLYFSGGILSYYDGARVAEASYLHAPRAPGATDSGAGSGPTGDYRYVTTFETTDGDGNWCLSRVSLPSNLLSIANNVATVKVSPLSITGRLNSSIPFLVGSLRVCLYRTLAGGEPPYYFLANLENDVSTQLTFSDSAVDADISSNRTLYGTGALPGTGGAQDRRAPPYCQDVVSYNGMLVVASGADLWWSGQTIGGEGVWFSPAFQVPIDNDGAITALATQDGTLYVFKRSTILSVAGEAPSDSGATGGLGSPRILATDVGCIDASSICVTSVGIFFQSDRGIELLTRSQSVAPFVGERVQNTVAIYPVCTSAILDPKRSLVRFSMASAESGGRASGPGVTLVYDLTIQAWISIDDYPSTEVATSACVVKLDDEFRYAWLGVDGVVHYERIEGDSNECLDGTSFVPASYTLPPWKVGLQQEQRIYEMEMLVERQSAAGLTIEVAHDFGAFGAEPDKVWTETETIGQRQLPFRPKPRGNAIQLRVTDTAPAVLGTGRGFTFVGISADITAKQGASRGTTRLNPELRR